MQKSKTFKLFSYTEDRCNVRISCSISKEGKIKQRNHIEFTNGNTRDMRSKSFSLFLSHEDEMYTNIRLRIGPYGNIFNSGQIEQKLISDSKKYELSMQEHRKNYRESHKEEHKEYSKIYDEQNKDKIKERKHQYYLNNKLHITERIKKYRETPTGKNVQRKHNAKRREFGFNPLNDPFPNCEGHHLNYEDVIFIPKELHVSVSHSVTQNRNMYEINNLAINYYWEEKFMEK